MRKMAQRILREVNKALTCGGFKLISVCSDPKRAPLRAVPIAFSALGEVALKQTGFTLDSNERRQLLSVTVRCELMGAQGDCSDRDRLIEMAQGVLEALTDRGFEAALSDSLKINGTLSRASCTLTAKKSVMIPREDEE